MREYLLVLLVAGLTTYLLAGPCRALALRVGAVAAIRDRDVHDSPTPYFGGVAMLGGVGAGFLLAGKLPFLSRHPIVTQDAAAVLLAGAVICAVGVLDDLLDLPALAKAAGQMLAAGVAVLNGIRVYWIPLPGSIIAIDPASSILITMIFVFLCVNAVNFVDGLDGLASGVVAIGSGAFFVYCYVLAYEHELVRATTASLITVVCAGVCVGFLPHNFHPARMFMGDSGAMLLGLLLACSTITFTGQIDPAALGGIGGGVLPSVLPIVLPLAVLAIPLTDLATSYWRRTLAGNWWFVADKQHLHHRLLERGHSQVRAVLLMYLWSAVIGFGAVAIGLLGGWVPAAVVGLGVLIALVLTLRTPARELPERPPVGSAGDQARPR